MKCRIKGKYVFVFGVLLGAGVRKGEKILSKHFPGARKSLKIPQNPSASRAAPVGEFTASPHCK
jgi:hypothetical protein